MPNIGERWASDSPHESGATGCPLTSSNDRNFNAPRPHAGGRQAGRLPLFKHSFVFVPRRPSTITTTLVQDSQIPTIVHNPNALTARFLKGPAELVPSSPELPHNDSGWRLVQWRNTARTRHFHPSPSHETPELDPGAPLVRGASARKFVGFCAPDT